MEPGSRDPAVFLHREWMLEGSGWSHLRWWFWYQCSKSPPSILRWSWLHLHHLADSLMILLMKEIPNNHLGCIKPCKQWDKLPSSTGDFTGFLNHQVEAKKWGNEKCRCIGYDGVPGSTNVTINGEEMPYPADAGASCSAWDAKNHPDCQGDFGKG